MTQELLNNIQSLWDAHKKGQTLQKSQADIIFELAPTKNSLSNSFTTIVYQLNISMSISHTLLNYCVGTMFLVDIIITII